MYWHNDYSVGGCGDDPIELLNQYWSWGTGDLILLNKVIQRSDFHSISFGNKDLGCSLKKASEDEEDV
jgi:hypothetical protein